MTYPMMHVMYLSPLCKVEKEHKILIYDGQIFSLSDFQFKS